MQHSYILQGWNIRLRPAVESDSDFIIKLRTSSHALGRVSDTKPSLESQLRWFGDYFSREGDYYFIIETSGHKPIGTIGLYNIVAQDGEWGRWIITPGIPAALPSAMLVYDFGFNTLGLSRIHGCVVSTNQSVISFHKRFGLRQTGIRHDALMIGGQSVDFVDFLLERSDWPALRQKHLNLADLAGRQIASINPF